MDVSRIEAFNPNTRINWQILTAREILNFENQGVEVPNIYLDWAQEFINSLDAVDKDTTTYEQAQILRNENIENVNNNGIVEEAPLRPQSQDNTDEVYAENDNTSTDGEENLDAVPQIPTPENILINAQSNRTQNKTEGENLSTPTITSSKEAVINLIKSKQSKSQITSANLNSNDEIRELERNMAFFTREAQTIQNNLKQETDNPNISSGSSYAKILQYQNELVNIRLQGQYNVNLSEAELNNFAGVLEAQDIVQTNTLNFGAETTSIGNNLIQTTGRENLNFAIMNNILGTIASAKGDLSQSAAENGLLKLNAAQILNTSNLEKALSYREKINEQTGAQYQIPNGEKDEDEQNNDETEIKNTPQVQFNKQNIKDEEKIKDEIDTATTASLDKILKRKIRRGEVPQ